MVGKIKKKWLVKKNDDEGTYKLTMLGKIKRALYNIFLREEKKWWRGGRVERKGEKERRKRFLAAGCLTSNHSKYVLGLAI